MSATASENTTNTPAPAAAHESAPSAMEQALRSAAQSLDSGQPVTDDAINEAAKSDAAAGLKPGKAGQSNASPTGERKAGNEVAAKPAAPEPKTAKTEAGQPALKKPDPKPGEQKPEEKKPGEQKPEEKPLSKFEQAKKERERYDRNWKRLQEEKAAFDRDRATFQQQQQHAAETQAQAAAAGPLRDRDGYTAQQWAKAAAEWEKTGKYDLAESALERAKALQEAEARGVRNPAPAIRPAASNVKPEMQPGSAEFNGIWKKNLDEMTAQPDYSDLGNKDTELFKATRAILDTEPRLSLFNDGIKIAAEIARLRLTATSMPALRQQLDDANKELEKLRKATSPGSGEAQERGEAKTFERMGKAEREAHLRKSAEAADAA